MKIYCKDCKVTEKSDMITKNPEMELIKAPSDGVWTYHCYHCGKSIIIAP